MSDRFLHRMRSTLARIYSKPAYIAINIVSLAVYYYIFTYLISVQQYGIFLATVPPYLIYLLVLSSSIALTVGLYSIKNTINNAASEMSTGLGTATALLGGVIGGCGCTEPLILGITVFGFSATDAFTLLDFISANQTLLFSLLIVINLFVVMYYLNKLSMPSCEIRKRRR